jgi:hypothetical protein
MSLVQEKRVSPRLGCVVDAFLIHYFQAARGYDKRAYQEVLDYNPYCGYVSLTNVPKHLGSIIWSTGWQIFISKHLSRTPLFVESAHHVPL